MRFLLALLTWEYCIMQNPHYIDSVAHLEEKQDSNNLHSYNQAVANEQFDLIGLFCDLFSGTQSKSSPRSRFIFILF